MIDCYKDSVYKNLKFAEKYKLKFLLGSDLTNAFKQLNIRILKSMYGKKYFGINRSAFILGSEGRLF